MKATLCHRIAGVLVLAAVSNSNALAGAPSADDILSKSRNRADGSDVYAEVRLSLIDEQGRERAREMYYLEKDYGSDDKLTLYFTGPAEVRGVAFQTVAYDEKKNQEDEQWLYLPAFRQVRRIASADKRGAFMGSEFAYIDMEKLRVKDYTQTIVGEEREGGRDCYVIERRPVSDAIVNKTGYQKTVAWVDKQSFLVLKQTYYDTKGILFKRMTVKQFAKVQDIWTVTDALMENLLSKRSSRIVFTNTHYDVGLADGLFQQNTMKTGVNRGNLPAIR